LGVFIFEMLTGIKPFTPDAEDMASEAFKETKGDKTEKIITYKIQNVVYKIPKDFPKEALDVV